MTTETTNDSLSRLVEKQQEEIDNIAKKIEIYSKYKDDYKELEKLINQMKDKIRHPYRIPIAGSKLAFIPGHIIHTNELTVLLGDNYFALRTAKQANEIIHRRLINLEDMLKKCETAKKKTEDWLKVTLEHEEERENFVEIIETM